MSKIKVADFYYGAVLSMLFSQHVKLAIVESDDNRQIYNLDTDNGSRQMFVKYRTNKTNTKAEDYYSWTFTFTPNEMDELNDLMNNTNNLLLALVCGVEGLSDSEIAILDKNDIEELLRLGKASLTISRKKKERDYRISTGGGRDAAMRVRFNRFDEVFGNKRKESVC